MSGALADPAAAPAAASSEPVRQRVHERLGIPRKLWHVFVALVAVVPATVALVFTFAPSLRPDPQEHLAGTLRAGAVDDGVSLGAYLQRVGQASPGLTRDQLRLPGHVVFVGVSVEGRKHRNVSLRYSIYDARRGTTIGPSDQSNEFFRADTPDDSWVAQVWVPSAGTAGKVFYRLMLYDGSTMLAYADTKPVGGGA